MWVWVPIALIRRLVPTTQFCVSIHLPFIFTHKRWLIRSVLSPGLSRGQAHTYAAINEPVQHIYIFALLPPISFSELGIEPRALHIHFPCPGQWWYSVLIKQAQRGFKVAFLLLPHWWFSVPSCPLMDLEGRTVWQMPIHHWLRSSPVFSYSSLLFSFPLVLQNQLARKKKKMLHVSTYISEINRKSHTVSEGVFWTHSSPVPKFDFTSFPWALKLLKLLQKNHKAIKDCSRRCTSDTVNTAQALLTYAIL